MRKADIKQMSTSSTPWRLRKFKSRSDPTLKDIEIDDIYKRIIECIHGDRYLYKYSKCTIHDMNESENIKQISDSCTEKLSDCTDTIYPIGEIVYYDRYI